MNNPELRSARALFERPVREINHQVDAGRDAYLSNGDAPPGIRSVIAASWDRTRSLGIDPDALRAPSAITLERIDEILRTQELGITGRRVLDRFSSLVEGSKHVIVLADERGRILYEVGHHDVYKGLEAINFIPGGDWSEVAVGPNGIGTPLALGRPELVLGSEHFCEGWKPWVCYGAPIVDPDSGLPVGAIDITGPSGAADMQTLALTVSIAQTVEQQLELALLQNRDLLRSRFREIKKRWPGDALVLLSDAGRIIEINRVAGRGLALDNTVFNDRPLAEVLPDLWLGVSDLVQTGRFGERRVATELASGATPTLRCRVEPVHQNERKVGAVVVISGFHGLSAHAAPPRRQAAAPKSALSAIIGSSGTLEQARDLAALAAADPDQTVLLLGETGTGKELFARGIHDASARRKGPFVAVNCGALPRELAESELFGYLPGAFTGASPKGQIGKFEAADGGTLFLDEIDSLEPLVQAKLLRVLEDLRVHRIGDHEGRSVDIRVIAAGSHELPERVAAGGFRRDLYHRLNVIDIRLPPLRERERDVVALARHFMQHDSASPGAPIAEFDDEALALLAAYHWPGNVRELQNLCRRVLLTTRGDTVCAADLPAEFHGGATGKAELPSGRTRSLRSISDEAIRAAVDAADGNIAEAARRLGINRTTIYRRQRHW